MRCLGAVALLMLVASAAGAAEPEPIDVATGLKKNGDWQLVKNNCLGCHSSKLITQQRGSEAHWLGMIRWMQEQQNLWQFDADTERRIVAYLATNYPAGENRRRAALSPALMPPNPYATDRDVSD